MPRSSSPLRLGTLGCLVFALACGCADHEAARQRAGSSSKAQGTAGSAGSSGLPPSAAGTGGTRPAGAGGHAPSGLAGQSADGHPGTQAAGAGGSLAGAAGSGGGALAAGTGGAGGNGGAAGSGPLLAGTGGKAFGKDCVPSKGLNVPESWIPIAVAPCTGIHVPSPGSPPVPDSYWEPCPPFTNGFQAECERLRHPWDNGHNMGADAVAAKGPDGKAVVGMVFHTHDPSNVPVPGAVMFAVVHESGKVIKIMAKSDTSAGIFDPGSIISVAGERYAFWVRHSGDPNVYNLYESWIGGTFGGPITGDALWQGDFPTSLAWSASEKWVVAHGQGGVRVSPWEPGDWTWIYQKSSAGPVSHRAAAVGPGVFLARGQGPQVVDVWTKEKGLQPLVAFPQDGQVREADLFDADEKDMVWTYREGLYDQPQQTGPDFSEYPVSVPYAVNDVYTAPFTTDAATSEKTKRRLRKALPHYSGPDRWSVGGGHAAIATIPYATIVRLSDGAAWQYKNQNPNQLINVAGITEEHLYVQMGYTGNGGASWIARWRLSSLPAPLPPD